jgi:hypothetical protein
MVQIFDCDRKVMVAFFKQIISHNPTEVAPTPSHIFPGLRTQAFLQFGVHRPMGEQIRSATAEGFPHFWKTRTYSYCRNVIRYLISAHSRLIIPSQNTTEFRTLLRTGYLIS